MRLPLSLLALAAALSMRQCLAKAPLKPPPENPAALQPAGPEVLAPDQVQAAMRKVADYQISHLNRKDNDWIRGVLFTGVMAAYTTTKDEKYLNEALRWANEEGNWTPPRDQRHADALCCGQTYLELYSLKHDPKMLGPIQAAIDRMMKTPKRGRVEWWWCDALYMAPPVLARLSAATGDPKYNAFMNEMWWDTTDFLFDKSEGLFYRDGSFFDKRTKDGKKVFWSRGNSWVMGGTVRVLQYLPANDPNRAKYVQLHQTMAARLAKLQGADGLWRPSLLDPEEFPSPETSGTALDCYAIAWGINNGTLERAAYLPVVQKAWCGLVGAVNKEGRLGYVQQVGASPGSVRPDGTQEYGVGGFLLAGSEMAKLSQTKERTESPRPRTWGKVATWEDPIAPYLRQFRADLKTAPAIRPTGLTRKDYLKLIAGDVDFFKNLQNEHGAIIDPYRKVEWQYSTPAFALSGAALVAYDGRTDLLEPAAKAMDWAVTTLSEGRAATRHEDFFAPLIANALPLLKPRVEPARAAKWEAQIRRFDPHHTYRGSAPNWNLVALSGEWIFHTLGLRDDVSFVEDSLARQDERFSSPWGLYLEGPMAYDHFPRLWAADMAAHGYDGKYAKDLGELLRRGSVTSLFMQSPTGELPTGGRSAQHQWNEAEQILTYELYGARALADGDTELAAAFKRAAHLALSSMQRWVRPSGEMWIVKNYVDPSQHHGYEIYSAHSQYNLLPMAMLAMAYQYAAKTEDLKELPAPADVGGFVIEIDSALHKVFANAGGMYVEIDTAADKHYNPTGLIRVQKSGFHPQLGPSDGLTATAVPEMAAGPKTDAAIGVAWKDANGQWKRLAGFGEGSIKATLGKVSQTPQRVSFQILYEGSFSGPSAVSETYLVTPDRVELTTDLPGYQGPTQYVWPVLADNGAQKPTIAVTNGAVTVALDGDTQTYTPVGAASVAVGDDLYPHRNGWTRVAVAEYPKGGPITLRIEPKAKAK